MLRRKPGEHIDEHGNVPFKRNSRSFTGPELEARLGRIALQIQASRSGNFSRGNVSLADHGGEASIKTDDKFSQHASANSLPPRLRRDNPGKLPSTLAAISAHGAYRVTARLCDFDDMAVCRKRAREPFFMLLKVNERAVSRIVSRLEIVPPIKQDAGVRHGRRSQGERDVAHDACCQGWFR